MSLHLLVSSFATRGMSLSSGRVLTLILHHRIGSVRLIVCFVAQVAGSDSWQQGDILFDARSPAYQPLRAIRIHLNVMRLHGQCSQASVCLLGFVAGPWCTAKQRTECWRMKRSHKHIHPHFIVHHDHCIFGIELNKTWMHLEANMMYSACLVGC